MPPEPSTRLCVYCGSNAGTNPAVNFLGTTDNVPLVLRVNAVQSGRIDPLNRSAYFGYDVANAITLFAGTEVGQNNAAFGHRALAANRAAPGLKPIWKRRPSSSRCDCLVGAASQLPPTFVMLNLFQHPFRLTLLT